MKRTLWIGVVVVVLGLGLALYLGVRSMDSLVRGAVEHYGSEATQTRVLLREVKLDLLQGTGILRGLSIANPPGFQTGQAFELEEIRLVLDTSSLLSPIIVIKEISIERPSVTYEVSRTGSNLAVIQRNVESFTAAADEGEAAQRGSDEPGATEGKETIGEDSDGPRLVIRDLRIQEGKVTARTSVLGSQEVAAALPEIHLENIGEASHGATPARVAHRIIESLAGGSAKALASVHWKGLQGAAKERLGRIGQKLGEKLGTPGSRLGEMFHSKP